MLTSLPPSPTASVKGLPLQDAPQRRSCQTWSWSNYSSGLHGCCYSGIIWHSKSSHDFAQLPAILIFWLVLMYQQTALRFLDGIGPIRPIPAWNLFPDKLHNPGFLCRGQTTSYNLTITQQSHNGISVASIGQWCGKLWKDQNMTCKHTHTHKLDTSRMKCSLICVAGLLRSLGGGGWILGSKCKRL